MPQTRIEYIGASRQHNFGEDEEKGIWNETEGDESISDAGRRPIGFSVPDDVIMTKE
ncbi:DUF6705 family protein [Bacteroides thetaiotaomicron]|uniref:DUF6705 family protein n=1 Tax=Bacteroides thetaiotaomicron TaxID=818 RepID=UPI00374F7E1D